MDERQSQVEVGAGLQESQLNQDLIDFLKKWGDWILYAVLAVVVVYAGSVWWGKHQDKKLDDAFAQWSGALGVKGLDGVSTGSPDNLLRVAEESAGRGSVRELATLGAADIYLACARRGIAPGGNVVTPSEDDILTEQETQDMLRRADELFRQVAQRTAGDKGHALVHMRAQWGVAASAASLDDTDRAREALQSIVALTDEFDYPDMKTRAERSIEELDASWTPIVLYAADELPKSNRPEEAPAVGAPSTPGTIQPIQISPPDVTGADEETGGEPESEDPVDTPADEPADDGDGDEG